MAFQVRGFRSLPQNPRRRRRRCVSSEWAICPSFLLASAQHPQRMALTEGLRPTENGTRRLNPLPRRDSSLCYRVCFARRSPVAVPLGNLRASGLRSGRGVSPSALERTQAGYEELLPFTQCLDRSSRANLQEQSSLSANYIRIVLSLLLFVHPRCLCLQNVHLLGIAADRG